MSKSSVRFRPRGQLQVVMGAILVALALGWLLTRSGYAQDPVPVTLTIWRLVEFENQDAGEELESGRGDYCAVVGFFHPGGGVEHVCPHPLSPPVVEGERPHGLLMDESWVIEPFWVWTQSIPPSWGSLITIEILVKDIDDGAIDLLDINTDPTAGRLPETLVITLNLETGIWTGLDVAVTPSCSASTGETGALYFDISVGAQTGDTDGDGLLDNWELHGFDDDCDGAVDVNLPAFGAEFDHKDLFLELDWMEGYRPTRDEIQEVKDAFAAAPKDAGTKASELAHLPRGIPGISAQSNPDNQDGINLWVAAGEVFNPSGSEDIQQPAGSCSDSADNDGDTLIDIADPDCIVAFIDDIPGGNATDVITNVSGLTEHFYGIKKENFNPSRRLTFRYGLASAETTNNTGTPFRVNPANVLVDLTKSWLIGEWISSTVTVKDGTGMTVQVREIISNTEIALFVDRPWDEPRPDDTWTYKIGLTGGRGEVGGNDFIVFGTALGLFSPLILPPNGAMVMHEFGHNLNLVHGGFEVHNCKPNYVSVMNYYYAEGIRQTNGGSILDFSPPRHAGSRRIGPLPVLNEDSLNETVILDNNDGNNSFNYRKYVETGREDGPVVFPFGCMDGKDNNDNGLVDRDDAVCYGLISSPLNQKVDWDGDRKNEGTDIDANIDLPANLNIFNSLSSATFFPADCADNTKLDELRDFNDWLHISLPFRQFGESTDGAVNPVIGPEPTLEERLQLQKAINATDVGISKSASPDPAVAGEPLTYILAVTNAGPNLASAVQVIDTLPEGVAYVSDTGGCVEGPSGTLTCLLSELLVGETREIKITVLVDADLAFRAGGPTTVTNTATVENLAGFDPDPRNNRAATESQIVALADLRIVLFEAIDPPTQILVNVPINLSLSKVITNGGPSAPMDVALTHTATAPADSIVMPAESTSVEMALGLHEERIVAEVFEVQCGSFSKHTFTFHNEIQPLGPNDIDPEQSNDAATVEVGVECVVPVHIDVEPKQINLKGNGVVPVKIFANIAGEFGLPLAFDPAHVDPLSVRFGSKEEVWTGTGGAVEVHKRDHGGGNSGHRIYHFRVRETGLTAEDSEACIKGTWFDESHAPHTFFGCDVVQVKRSGQGKNDLAAASVPLEESGLESARLYLPLIQRQ
ncbi:MAG: DUF11 domain-containing protein [Caldilineaceae bacterium]|nr:DUF11 domain-containing protein [Caldilineaceae bacterium]